MIRWNIAICDDEKVALELLGSSLRGALRTRNVDASIETFSRPRELLLRMQTTSFDLLFLDIEMPGMNGIELAQKLKAGNESINIIFVTAHAEHALEAHGMYVSGFLLKPASEDDVRTALSNLRNPIESENDERITVRCFGDFDVFHHGEPLKFDRNKSKELFAYLVHRKGARCSISELITALWEDASNSASRRTQVRNLIHDLKTTLEPIGQDDIIVRGRDSVAIKTEALNCDLFRFLKGEPGAVNLYHGEYMAQYDWADMTESML